MNAPRLLTCAVLAALGSPEEKSVMDGCSMIDRDLYWTYVHNANAICDGGFKTMAHTTCNLVSGGDKEIVSVLSEAKQLKSAFVQNRSMNVYLKKRMGKSALYIGEDTGAFTVGTKCSQDFFDSGFYRMTCNTKGKNVALRRGGPSTDLCYNPLELRLYQTQNLLQLQGVTISAPAPTSPQWSATNLLKNFDKRTPGNNIKPLIDLAGNQATWESCFKTGAAQLLAHDNKLVLNINLGAVYFQHAVLAVQDLFDGTLPTEMNDKLKYFQNYEIYIGNSPNFAENPKCPKGPFMRTDDPDSFVYVSFTGDGGYTGLAWKFGKEVWCNMEGQFIAIVADLSGLAGQTSTLAPNGYEMSLCHLAVFGTQYVRTQPVPGTFEVLTGTPAFLDVEKITADAALPIGNTLDITLRQKVGAELFWVTFTQDSLVTRVNLAPDRTVAPGVYTLVLESFDQAGGVYSALKTDTISVTVLPPPECGKALTHSFETSQVIKLTQEYLPTVFYPEQFFTGTLNTAGYSCGGAYSQSVRMEASVAGVVLTDQPSGPDLRPRITIDGSALAGSTFSLTFSGRYQYAPTSTDISASFTQTFLLDSVFQTDYLEQPTITHSLSAEDLTFIVPPQTTGGTTPVQSLAASSFTLAYLFKSSAADTLGNIPPLVSPLPYTGFTQTSISKGKPTLGTTSLASPKGALTAQGVGVSGNLSTGVVSFTCAPWTAPNKITATTKTLNFFNSAVPAFKAKIDVTCGTTPNFASGLATKAITAGVASTWTLPTINEGHYPLAQVRFLPEDALLGFLAFYEPSRVVSYDGNPNIIQVFGKHRKVKILLVDTHGNETPYEQTLVGCPISREQIDALATQLLAEPLVLSVTAKKDDFKSLVFKNTYDRIVEQLAFNDSLQSLCGGISIELTSKHSFLQLVPQDRTLILKADLASEPAVYEDSYVTLKLSVYSLKIPIRAEFTSCKVTLLSFEKSKLDIEYQVGSGIKHVSLPPVLQKPDCGSVLGPFYTKQINSSQIPAPLVQKAVTLDLALKAVDVVTEDASFVGKNATVTVSIDAVGVEQVLDLVVTIEFVKVASTNSTMTNEEPSADSEASSNSQQEKAQIATTAHSENLEKANIFLEVSSDLGARLGVPGLVVPPVTEVQAEILRMSVATLSEDQLFASVPLAARLTRGVDQVFELKTMQRRLFDNMMASSEAGGGARPPEVHYDDFTNFGIVELSFTQSLNIPSDLEKAIKQAQEQELQRSLAGEIAYNATLYAIQVFAVSLQDLDDDEMVEPIMKRWELVSLRRDGVTIKVHFYEPLRVSTGENPDQLLVQLELSVYPDKNGKTLPQSVLKVMAIPTQFASETEANAVTATGIASESTSQTALFVNFLVNLLLAGSMSPVWSLINSLQVVQMNRLFYTNVPGNVNSFTEFFQSVTSIKAIEALTQIWIDAWFKFPEQDPFSVHYLNAGYKSKIFILNTQQHLFLLAIFIALSLLCVVLWPLAKCCPKVARFRQKLLGRLFWNGFIRLMTETFCEIVLFALMNLYAKDWPKGQKAVTVDIVTTSILLSIYALLPTILLVISWRKYERHVDENTAFTERIGSFLNKTSRKPEAKCGVLLFTLTFYVRRFTLALTLIFWHDFFWGQIAVQFAVSTFLIILLQTKQPLETPFGNRKETSNEYASLNFLYLLMCFTPFVPDPETRNLVGTVYIIILCLFVASHLAFIVCDAVKTAYWWLRRRCRKKPNKPLSPGDKKFAEQTAVQPNLLTAGVFRIHLIPMECDSDRVNRVQIDTNVSYVKNQVVDSQLIEDHHRASPRQRQSRRPKMQVQVEESRADRQYKISDVSVHQPANSASILINRSLEESKKKQESGSSALQDFEYFERRYGSNHPSEALEESTYVVPGLRRPANEAQLVDELHGSWPMDVENKFWPQNPEIKNGLPAVDRSKPAFEWNFHKMFESPAPQSFQTQEMLPVTQQPQRNLNSDQKHQDGDQPQRNLNSDQKHQEGDWRPEQRMYVPAKQRRP